MLATTRVARRHPQSRRASLARLAGAIFRTSSFFKRPMAATDQDRVGEKILQNEELVQRILDSANDCSAPMNVSAFREWLKSLPRSDEPAGDTEQGGNTR
jgi:hypothetical protein